MKFAYLCIVASIVCLPFFLLWLVTAAVINVGGWMLNIKREKRV